MGTELKLQGQRIIIRDWLTADIPVMEKWLQPGQRWQSLDGPYYPVMTPESRTAFLGRITRQTQLATQPHPRQRAVIATRADSTLVGTLSRYWIGEETNWLAVGIVIYDPALWGQGLGYEALGLWSDYLFNSLPEIVRLDLRTWSGNHGMMGLAQKIGYQEEARFRMARIVDGQFYDGMGYGVLRGEWEERYPAGFAAHLLDG